jgi:aryl-alcohol dehydrogenase-like predicted oxidoreductase
VTELALGTANWGAAYGAPGRPAFVDEQTALALAREFTQAGHDLVDTARAYGHAERLVGLAFDAPRLITKIALPVDEQPLIQCLQDVERTRRRTGVGRLSGVLLHDPEAALVAPDRARAALEALRAGGTVDRVGVSVYTPEQAMAAVERLRADLVQVPCNLLDQRFLRSGCMDRLQSLGVQVHVRSAFLNGLLLGRPEDLPAHLADLREPVAQVHREAAERGISVLAMALGFCVATGADAVVVGAVDVPQLREVLDAWRVTDMAALPDLSGLASDSPLVDPRTWST